MFTTNNKTLMHILYLRADTRALQMEIVSYSACNFFEQIVADKMWQPVVVGHSVKEYMNTKMFFDRYNRSAKGFEKNL